MNQSDIEWRVGNDDPELTIEEFDELCTHANESLEQLGTVNVKNADFHIVEDLYADRTLKIYIENISRATAELIQALQQLLIEHGPLWRILLVREPHSKYAIWIYPERVIPEKGTRDLDESYKVVLLAWQTE